ncbi:unnamed protein product, partial [Callosobruchus maculatus]
FFQTGIDGSKPQIHCRLKNDTTNWCDDKSKVSPKAGMRVLDDFPFSNDTDNPLQVKPQRIKLALRKGEKYDLKFQYKSTENYPVDLYYIMDLSHSMKEYKDDLARLGSKLAETMRNITTNFKLGFGSFIDKVELPFVSTNEKKLKNPCPGCASPYSFKNHLSLTSNYEEFVNNVKAAKVSGNLDSPEGGFDAIMQAIVCKEKIRWRKQARHLLVFSTDAEFHIAGDGKLAGVIEPNIAKCYTDDREYLKYDYPSVSQLNYVAQENNINIIFAIVKKPYTALKESYATLSKHIKNSNFGELNSRDANSVINLVLDNYKKIVQSVKFTSNSTNEIDIKFSSTCKSPIPDRCSNVHIGEVLDITATIQARECLPDGQKSTFVYLKPEALHQGLVVEIEVLCDCPCSSKAHPSFVPNAKECSRQGDLKCGVCTCSEGRFGRKCQCDSSISTSEDIKNCIMEGSNEVCSGFGKCQCGKCECDSSSNRDEKIYGQYCQCNNYSCKKENGLLCSGRGKCNCGVCECQAGYSGDACQCEESTTNCIAPGSDSICSNHGSCVCGQCECKMDENRYSGKYCEDCISCPAQRCEELRHCVEYKAYNEGIYKTEIPPNNCTAFDPEILEKLDDIPDKDVKKCRILDANRCIMNFDYYYEDRTLIVRVLDHKVCPAPPNVSAWIAGVVTSILLAGIVMLIVWKVFTTIHDRREYAKFENEKKALKWHNSENPLYRGATTTFANPAYNRPTSFSPEPITNTSSDPDINFLADTDRN